MRERERVRKSVCEIEIEREREGVGREGGAKVITPAELSKHPLLFLWP